MKKSRVVKELNQEKLLICTDSIFFSEFSVSLWASQGYTFQHVPLLKFQKIDVHNNFQNISDVMITSANAISALLENFDKNTRVYTISQNMAQRIQNAGYQNIFFDSLSDNSSSLGNVFLKHPSSGDVVYLCGERIRSKIDFENIKIMPVPVYRMLPITGAVNDITSILKANNFTVIHVSSEQAIDVLRNYKISFEKILFKSDHLKNYWLKKEQVAFSIFL